MNFETVVHDLFTRFPKYQEIWDSQSKSMDDARSIQYDVFGSVLVPALEEALSAGNLGTILKISAFLEDASEAARYDRSLESLLRVEIGEWLQDAPNVTLLAPWLGTETKRVCGYLTEVVTQRIVSREDQKERTLGKRAFSFLQKLFR
jgi:hypothetical protein